MVTRRGFVAKKWHFPVQNDDEKWSRRQKKKFPVQKWRREVVSSPKNGVFCAKMTTRKGFIAKKWSFSCKNDDEKGFRRQKVEFFVQKWRRERVSSPKSGVFRAKVTTRSGLVAKKWHFPAQNDDEKWSRRQKMGFLAQKWRREVISSPKSGISRLKMTTRSDLVAKNGVSRPKMTTRNGLVAKKWSFPHKNDDEKRSRRQKVAFPPKSDDEKWFRRQKMEFPA